jgi:hypothetical protein
LYRIPMANATGFWQFRKEFRKLWILLLTCPAPVESGSRACYTHTVAMDWSKRRRDGQVAA